MGTLNWASGLIPLGLLHLRPLQQHFHSYKPDKPVYNTVSIIPFSPCHPTQAMAVPIVSYVRNPYLIFPGGVHDFTDASTQCWSIHMGDSQIAGVWTRSKRRLHINVLEFKAVILAFQHFVAVLQCHHVLIAMDNTTVVAYINKQGGSHCHALLRLVVDLFLWLQTQDITLGARHIPCCLNVIADRLSWLNQPITTEWSLYPTSSSVYVSSSGASSTGDRCPVTGLAGEVDVRFHHFPCSAKSFRSSGPLRPDGRDVTHSPLVAITTVVSTSTTSVCGPPTLLSIPPRPAVTTGIYLELQVVPSA